jgi:hypothetical protein
VIRRDAALGTARVYVNSRGGRLADRFLRISIMLIVAAFTRVNGASGETLPHDLDAWQVDFTITGTIKGLAERLTLDQSGNLIAGGLAGGIGSRVEGRASPDLLAAVNAWLQVARPEKPDDGPPIADALLLTAVLASGGQQYPLDVPPYLYPPLQAAYDAVISQALLGRWRETGWTLCTPAAQLTAADYDLPIDELSFHPDGTFTVTWRGGGAHTTGVPHVFIPDYEGHYDADAAHGYLGLRFERGIINPRDFAGDGHFTITATELTLHDIWLGTRQAPKKPNICELTFAREADAPPDTSR